MAQAVTFRAFGAESRCFHTVSTSLGSVRTTRQTDVGDGPREDIPTGASLDRSFVQRVDDFPTRNLSAISRNVQSCRRERFGLVQIQPVEYHPDVGPSQVAC